jgi:hypothetical protein
MPKSILKELTSNDVHGAAAGAGTTCFRTISKQGDSRFQGAPVKHNKKASADVENGNKKKMAVATKRIKVSSHAVNQAKKARGGRRKSFKMAESRLTTRKRLRDSFGKGGILKKYDNRATPKHAASLSKKDFILRRKDTNDEDFHDENKKEGAGGNKNVFTFNTTEPSKILNPRPAPKFLFDTDEVVLQAADNDAIEECFDSQQPDFNFMELDLTEPEWE